MAEYQRLACNIMNTVIIEQPQIQSQSQGPCLGNSFDTYYPPAVSITKDMALSSQVSCGPAQSSQRTSTPEWPSYTSNSTWGQVPRARPAQPCLEARSRLCRSLVETCGALSTLDVQGWRARKTRQGKQPFRKALYLQRRLLHWNCVAPAVLYPGPCTRSSQLWLHIRTMGVSET